ncbi:RluA family pseudouridine synthase [Allofranklinella schreckenbergeri]|uniref:Pseudouridine synthase n=1 Tax=Allofranklinella schreckenbergeri TaxID=1076744 RepID=A0A3M6QFE7_9BURK|nr:RluA family pseudouridine synthase [Allofranklinella schreckenbergeri]RMX01757.1 RluA family pseudouridine synthase [Allofranklinella schreckenbergeri]
MSCHRTECPDGPASRLDAAAQASDAAELELAAEQRCGQIVAAWHGQRLDKVVLELAGEFSRSHLQQLIKSGQVLLDGQCITKPAHKVQVGQRIAITLQATAQSQAFVPQAMPLPIVYEDEAILVIDKPAGLVVHPAAGNWSGTLLNGLLAYDSALARLPRAGIVHRLDKDTSGLMVVAKTLPAQTALVERIAARQVSRQYLAVASRSAQARSPWQALGESVRVDAPIGRDPRNRLRMAVLESCPPGKLAQTDMRLLAGAPVGNDVDAAALQAAQPAQLVQPAQARFALLHCSLHTGRTHQIRVHARHLGWPLVGDATYGGPPHAAIARQALHAWRLGLEHPLTGQALQWHSPLPADMQALLAALGLPLPE